VAAAAAAAALHRVMNETLSQQKNGSKVQKTA
jgi:hypothetical protein